MNRITIFAKQDSIAVITERLQEQPSGNVHERKKALRSGWQPQWIKVGQPSQFQPALLGEFFIKDMIHIVPMGETPQPPEIEAARIIALCVREAAMRTPEQLARLRTEQRNHAEAANCARIADSCPEGDSMRRALLDRAAELRGEYLL